MGSDVNDRRVHEVDKPVTPDSFPWIVRIPGVLLTGVWAFAEASFFFLLPDIPLTLAASYSPRRALRHLLALVCGALVGGAGMFYWATQSDQARAAVAHVPRVSASMFEQAQAQLDAHGAMGMVYGPAMGVPYKVFATLAPASGVSWGAFLLNSVAARVWRPLLMWAVFSLIGAGLVRVGKAHWRWKVVALWWSISVTLYWMHVH